MRRELAFDSTQPLNTVAKGVIKQALLKVFGHTHTRLIRVPYAPLHFGVSAPSVTEMAISPNAVSMVAQAIRASLPVEPKTPWSDADPNAIRYLDIETHEADKRWSMPLGEFFRLGQYAWGPTGDVTLTTSLAEVLAVCETAQGIVAHNGHAFDFSVLLGDAALEMAFNRKLFDTMVFANQVYPAPYRFVKRDGTAMVTLVTLKRSPRNMAGLVLFPRTTLATGRTQNRTFRCCKMSLLSYYLCRCPLSTIGGIKSKLLSTRK